jgi:tetratricopeptide (TPR) repeat protein
MMGFFSRLFSRSADDFLSRGDELFAAQRYFEARGQFEDGLQFHLAKAGGADSDSVAAVFCARIAQSNTALAAMNISEAEFAVGRGADAKAVEHLELALSLTDDRILRQKAEQMLSTLAAEIGDSQAAGAESAQGHCQTCSSSEPVKQALVSNEGMDMSPHDYYNLLIRQLPDEVYVRYAGLGEDFASMYLTASRDDHESALVLLEQWYQDSDTDIYCYQKGMILHRLGRIAESEACLREAYSCNPDNPLPRIGLALLLIDGHRPDEAAELLDIMISDGILTEQALMLRGDVSLLTGDYAGAIDRFGSLLATPYARPAAEKLHELLLHGDRKQEAAAVFKKYLGGCRH